VRGNGRGNGRPGPTRCAIYTRKSTAKGLDGEFTTLDAQREAGEAFVTSQRSLGWVAVADRYDDGGYSGGTTDRPALHRLLADVEGGRIDCVVVYKADRLSRSLLDFARLLETLDRHDVAFVSVTEQFNTSTPAGRLMLNMIASFAEYERALIAERTSDKMSAARRKGRYTGGVPVLGYRVEDRKLVVDEAEAVRVRAIFDLFLDQGSLSATARELARRGWERKRWVTRKGEERGGGPFTKPNLHQLLTNVVYLGRVRHRGKEFPGEHDAIIDQAVFEEVQRRLRSNGHRRAARSEHGAFLRGLLYCAHCGCRMNHATTRKGGRVYRYYVCSRAQSEGWSSCRSPSIAAGDIEAAVLDEIRTIGADPDLVMATLREARRLRTAKIRDMERELKLLADQLTNGLPPDRRREAERRRTRLERELDGLSALAIDRADLAATMGEWEPIWLALTFPEQAELAGHLIERIVWDGVARSMDITFREEVAHAVA
jgi:site-specific DNA recombinase